MLIEISFVYLLILFLNLYFADDISVGVFNLRTNVFLCYFYSFFTNDRCKYSKSQDRNLRLL